MFLDFVERLRASPAGFGVSAAQSKSLRRFLKDEYLNKMTNEVVNVKTLVAMIDEKLNEFNELMGYYVIAMSELDAPDQEIIGKCQGLTQVEDQSREMKGMLESRPVFVNITEHIHAHLIICLIALTTMRLMQRRIAMAEPKSGTGGDFKRSCGMSGERLSKAPREWWWVLRHNNGVSQMLNSSREDLRSILAVLGVNLKPTMYTEGTLTH